MRLFQVRFIIIILGILFFTNPIFSQVENMTTQELVNESTTILVGKCVDMRSMWNEKKDKIFTEVRVQSSQYLKGDLGSEATILVPGGRVGNIIYEVSEMPVFERDEEALLFLWRHPSGKNLVTNALHGKLSIVKDKKSGAKIILGAPLQSITDRQIAKEAKTKPARKPMLLDDFIREVKGMVNAKEGSHE